MEYADNIPIYYRLEIDEDLGGGGYQRVFATGRIKDLSFFTLPLNVLKLNTSYRWRIRVIDNPVYKDVQNRANSTYKFFSTPASWALHSSPHVLGPDNWNSVSWSTDNGTSYLCSVKVIDLDGVSSGGFTAERPPSHTVTVTFPGGQSYDLEFDGADSPTSVNYYTSVGGMPPSGTYTFTVSGPDGPAAVFTEEL